MKYFFSFGLKHCDTYISEGSPRVKASVFFRLTAK